MLVDLESVDGEGGGGDGRKNQKFKHGKERTDEEKNVRKKREDGEGGWHGR